jgi:hypothetical protein
VENDAARVVGLPRVGARLVPPLAQGRPAPQVRPRPEALKAPVALPGRPAGPARAVRAGARLVRAFAGLGASAVSGVRHGEERRVRDEKMCAG